MTVRYLCIHGHFYQPPRENPWLEAVEIQDSAHPYHDWNERITAECYAPNTASRILDGEKRIVEITNNYSRMSFNFGPTLLAWMEQSSPEVYGAILAADRLSMEWRSGHGNAIAQAYNHVIMPLANRRDKRTQVIWGIRDFEKRFLRRPEGMWLPEAAVDCETLGILAEMGISFTILAPGQAARVKKIGSRKWTGVGGGTIDPSRPYRCNLPGGRKIDIFFYDGPISAAVAFERLLDSGESFANRLLDGFSDTRDWPQLMHIATDGESYGHHHRHGDMALAYSLNSIESRGLARLTNYGEYLEKHPPTHEVEIIENSSWSCIHGIERWRKDCGCNSGGYAGWNQQWRAPLRQALEWLRDQLIFAYEHRASRYLVRPWQARDDYIDIILDRSEESINAFLEKHATTGLKPEERVEVLKMLEMQRHAMLMFTSCGWFFDELSGIETVQILQYAGRALQLMQDLFGDGIEESFLKRLKAAKSNLKEHGDGAAIYGKMVKPAMITTERVAAHYAVSSIFEDYPGKAGIFSYEVEQEDYSMASAGNMKLAIGKIGVLSEITRDLDRQSICVLHLGDHILNGGVRRFLGDEQYDSMKHEITSSFEVGDFVEIIRLMDKHFGTHNYSLFDLFRDEQRKIAGLIVENAIKNHEETFRSVFEQHRILMGFLHEIGKPLPKMLRAAAEVTLGAEVKKLFSVDSVDVESIMKIAGDSAKWGLSVDSVDLEFIARRKAEELFDGLLASPAELPGLLECLKMMQVLEALEGEVNLWQIQNKFHIIAKTVYGGQLSRVRSGDRDAERWTSAFKELGEKLFFNTGAVLPEN
jgi:alpha-amylase/alpha-mannosidase (GH57 family)